MKNFVSITPSLVKKQEIADRYNVCVRSVENLVRRGVLPCYRLGRSIRFSVEECDAAMRNYRFGPRQSEVKSSIFSGP